MIKIQGRYHEIELNYDEVQQFYYVLLKQRGLITGPKERQLVSKLTDIVEKEILRQEGRKNVN